MHARLAGERVAVDAAGEAHDLDRVVDDGPPGAQALPRLVEQGRRRRRTCRGGGSATGRSVGSSGPPPSWWMTSRLPMQRDEVLHDLERAGPPAAVEVRRERRPADGTEDEVVAHRRRGSGPGSGRGA